MAAAVPAEARTSETPCCCCATSAHGRGDGKPGGKCSMPGCACEGYRPRAVARKPEDSPITRRVRELAREGLDTATIRARTGASRERINYIRREMGLAGAR